MMCLLGLMFKLFVVVGLVACSVVVTRTLKLFMLGIRLIFR